MERLKLVNVLKSTFLGSEFHTKNAAITRVHRIFLHNLYL